MNNPFQANRKTESSPSPVAHRPTPDPASASRNMQMPRRCGNRRPKGELAVRPLSPMKSIRPKWKVQNGQMEMENENEASCLIIRPSRRIPTFTFKTSQIEYIWLVKSRQTFVRIKIAKQIKQGRIYTRTIFTLLKAIPIVLLPSHWGGGRAAKWAPNGGQRLKAYNKLSNLN